MAIHECFPYLRARDAEAAIGFYVRVFGGRELFRLVDPADGRIGHAELELAPGIVLMVSDEYPEYGITGPSGATGAGVHLHVDDCDAVIARAAAEGAEVLMAPQDQFYGERGGKFRDPFGHEWMIGHSIEKLTPAEMQKRWDEGAL